MRKLGLAGLVWVLCSAILLAEEWTKLEDCRLEPNPSNDGDSFHVKHQGRELYFRLYFVDCPETNWDLKDRIREQCEAFDLEAKDVVHMGEEAERFTREQLRGSFTVWTRWQDAKGNSDLTRYFAFVRTEKGRDLAALLLENGLARLYGASADHPEGMSVQKTWDAFGGLLAQARASRVGCWARERQSRHASFSTSDEAR